MGAHPQTLRVLSGMSRERLRLYVLETASPSRPGRPCYGHFMSDDVSLRESVLFVLALTKYLDLRAGTTSPLRALVAAYRFKVAVDPTPKLVPFDAVFSLVSSVEGLWLHASSIYRAKKCSRCQCVRLRPASASAARPYQRRECLVCLFWERRSRNDVTTASDPASEVGREEASPAPLLERLAFVQRWQSLGAHDSLIAELMRLTPDASHHDAAFIARNSRLLLGSRRQVSTFCANLSTVEQVQLSVAVASYRRMRAAGVALDGALRIAYLELRHAYRVARPIGLDRLFDVLLLTGVDGREPEVDLSTCSACGAQYLAAPADRRPEGCPFCRVRRWPRRYTVERLAPPCETDSAPRAPRVAAFLG